MVQVQLPLPFSLGPLVKRSRHRPFTAVTGVRFPHGSPLGSLAQLGEHLPYKQRVSGSSPLTSTTKTTHESEWFFFLSLETAGFPGRASCVGNTSYPDGSFFQHRLSGVLELRKRVRLFPGGRFFAEIQRENAPSADGGNVPRPAAGQEGRHQGFYPLNSHFLLGESGADCRYVTASKKEYGRGFFLPQGSTVCSPVETYSQGRLPYCYTYGFISAGRDITVSRKSRAHYDRQSHEDKLYQTPNSQVPSVTTR